MALSAWPNLAENPLVSRAAWAAVKVTLHPKGKGLKSEQEARVYGCARGVSKLQNGVHQIPVLPYYRRQGGRTLLKQG